MHPPRRTLGALAAMVIASIMPSVDGMVSAAMTTKDEVALGASYAAAYTEDSVKSVSKDSVDASSQLSRKVSQAAGGEAANVRDKRVQSSSGSSRRRSRRRSKKTSSTSTRRRSQRRRSRRRRRRRAETSSTKKSKKTSGKKSSPVALKADAKADKIEAGWADMAKRDAAFTVFVHGSSLDKDKDRIVVIDGEGTCGSSASRIAQVTGVSEKPGGSLNDWKNLECNAGGGSSKRLACGDGGSKGVLWKDDKFAEAYNFKVCVCDFSKRGKCEVMSDFDLTPTSSTLRVEPVV